MKKSLMLSVLVVAILLVVGVSSAFADSVTTTGTVNGGGKLQSIDTVTVKATVNPKLVLTVVTPNNTQTVDFGTVDPGTVYGPSAVTLTVNSNKAYDVTKVTAGQNALMGLNTSLGVSLLGNAKTASQVYTDNYTLNVPWTTDPAAYSATVQYTVVQN
jgi:hypothetical protein